MITYGNFSKQELFNMNVLDATPIGQAIGQKILIKRWAIIERLGTETLYIESVDGKWYATTSSACIDQMKNATELDLIFKSVTPEQRSCRTSSGRFTLFKCEFNE